MKKPIFLAVFFAFIPFVTFASFDKDIKYGSVGAPVVELQEFLMEQGFLNVPNATGNFFSVTLKAVKAYQESQGLPATGFVGPMTRGKINDYLARAIGTSDEQETAETGTVAPAVVQCPVGYTCSKGTDDAVSKLAEQVSALKTELQKQTVVQEQIRENTTKVTKTPVPAPAPVQTKQYGMTTGQPQVVTNTSGVITKAYTFTILHNKNIAKSTIQFPVTSDDGVVSDISFSDDWAIFSAETPISVRVSFTGEAGKKYSIGDPKIIDVQGSAVNTTVGFPINGEL